MEVALNLVLGLAIVLLVLTLMGRRNSSKYAPASTSLIPVILNFNRMHDFLTEHYQHHRTFRISFHTFDYICTSDTANIEHILKTNFENYGKGNYHYEILSDLLGDGIFTVDGELWKQQRKKASFEFSARVLRDFSSSVFKENAVKICRELMDACISKQTVELQSLLLKSTMVTIGKVGFGVDIGTDSDTESARNFAYAFDCANSLLFWRYVDPFWKVKKFLNIGSEAKLKKCVETVDNFVYQIIHKRRQEMATHKEHEKSDILSRFMAMETEENTKDRNDRYLRDIILNFIIAGRDTTAVTLCWFFYCLCKNPHVEGKILAEICSLLKIDMSAVTFETATAMFLEKLNYSTLDKMHYLHAALSETLRLYPAVPLETKFVFSNDIFPDGTMVKKGNKVAYSPYAIGRLTNLWGSDAKMFRPERWLDNYGIFQPKSPFLFTAFQAGPRTCLGKEFAYIQMKTIASFLLYFFKFESVQGKEVHYRISLTLHMTQEGLNLHVKPRSQV